MYLDLEVKYVKLNLRSNCMSTDIVIVFVFFAGPIRGYSPDGRVNNFTRTVAGGIATSMTQRNAATTQHNATQRNTTQHNTTQHNTTQHNTIRFGKLITDSTREPEALPMETDKA